MKIGRPEAIDLLRKWEEEKTLIECVMEFPSFSTRLRARVSKVEPSRLRLMSDDTTSELALNLEPWLQFGYGDTRGLEAADEFEGILVIFFRMGEGAEPSDRISLSEVIS